MCGKCIHRDLGSRQTLNGTPLSLFLLTSAPRKNCDDSTQLGIDERRMKIGMDDPSEFPIVGVSLETWCAVIGRLQPGFCTTTHRKLTRGDRADSNHDLG
jgi:hypothetical protein